MFPAIKSIFKNPLEELYSLITKNELHKKNINFSGIIDDFTNIENSNYLKLSIIIGNYICDEFISLKIFNNNIKKGNIISFCSKDIKINIVNNKNFIEILVANFKNDEKQIKTDISYKKFHFDCFKFSYTYNDIWNTKSQLVKGNNNYIYSIILKVKHVEQLGHQYEFCDIYNDNIPVDYTKIKNLIEGQKTYIVTKEIEIIDGDFKGMKLKLNKRLFKKISFGCMCTFKCFKKNINENIIMPTEFSDIIVEEKTSILFNIVKLNKYYNQIIVDNIIKDIGNEDEMEIDINIKGNEKNLFKKKLH